MHRLDSPTPHRELFHAVTIDETVALSCTCARGADHWHVQPARAAASSAAHPRRSTYVAPAMPATQGTRNARSMTVA